MEGIQQADSTTCRSQFTRQAANLQEMGFAGYLIVGLLICASASPGGPRHRPRAARARALRRRPVADDGLPCPLAALATCPPFFGFASALTFCGFTYGLWPGIPIAFVFTLGGSSLAFGVYRYLLKDQFRGMMGNKSGRGREGGKYEAFQAVVVSRFLGCGSRSGRETRC